MTHFNIKTSLCDSQGEYLQSQTGVKLECRICFLLMKLTEQLECHLPPVLEQWWIPSDTQFPSCFLMDSCRLNMKRGTACRFLPRHQGHDSFQHGWQPSEPIMNIKNVVFYEYCSSKSVPQTELHILVFSFSSYVSTLQSAFCSRKWYYW